MLERILMPDSVIISSSTKECYDKYSLQHYSAAAAKICLASSSAEKLSISSF